MPHQTSAWGSVSPQDHGTHGNVYGEAKDAVMRTTLEIAEDVLVAAHALASERRISLGAALSELARRGLAVKPIALEDDRPVFEVDETHPVLTPEDVDDVLR